MDEIKEQEARQLLDELYQKMEEDDGLHPMHQGMFDTLAWLFDGLDKPEI
jgi:truncated hemoglobin YjbI